ncbi:alpha/beta hydrolase [Nocardioides salsibiostraticola]
MSPSRSFPDPHPAATSRVDVSFSVEGSSVAAWFYPAQASGRDTSKPAPCVVMAHGFGLTKRDGLDAYARRFAAAGTHVLVFDHRFLGESGGRPRQRFRIGDQQQDWRRAVEYARSLPQVDATRVVLWGFSFSGGHVTTLVSRQVGAAAALVLCPFADGLRRVLTTPLSVVAWILPRAILDLLGFSVRVPVTAPPGRMGAMTLPGESAGFASATTADWCNEISPAVFLTVALFRPVTHAKRVAVPLWVGRCDDDVSVDAEAVARLARVAPRGERQDFAGDHFAPFNGGCTEEVIASQVEFLRRTVLD